MPDLYADLNAHLDKEQKEKTQKNEADQSLFEGVESSVSAAPVLDQWQRLGQQLDDETTGITTFDVIKLRGLSKQLMLLFLRDAKAATLGLNLSEISRQINSSAAELSSTLAELVETGWVIQLGEPPHYSYRLHMKRKRTSDLGLGIWDTLSKRLKNI